MNPSVSATPKVSVIIPTYNRGHLLAQAITSVLEQTYPVLELIVVDDGSTDNTDAVVAEFGDAVRYLYQTNQGVSAARNHGIREATGELLSFLDSDDWYAQHKVERQVQHLIACPTLAMVCSDYYLVDEVRNRNVVVEAIRLNGPSFLQLMEHFTGARLLRRR